MRIWLFAWIMLLAACANPPVVVVPRLTPNAITTRTTALSTTTTSPVFALPTELASSTFTSSPAPTRSTAATPYPNPNGQIRNIPSPSSEWTAILDLRVGSLDLKNRNGRLFPIFPPGSIATQVTWSPDSRRLFAVRNNYWLDPQMQIQTYAPLQIWEVQFQTDAPTAPALVFQSLGAPPELGVFGSWSPNQRYLVFWVGINASGGADGLGLWVLDVETNKTIPLADTALMNPKYQSWAPDSSALAFTAGGYRSAQVNKWLNIFDAKTNHITNVVTMTEQIPGIVAWSPRGDLIAYAAVQAQDTSWDWADYMGFTNPAILARRIYLLDPKTGKHWRLNAVKAFQDAPVWSNDGTVLYYVQREGDEMVLMATDPTTGQTQTVPGSHQPAPNGVGYYGQSNWVNLLEHRPSEHRAPTPTDARPTTKPSSTIPKMTTVTGQVVEGYGDHLPVAGLPFWIGKESIGSPVARTDANGDFTIALDAGSIPSSGVIDIVDGHLQFQVPLDPDHAEIHLGLLKYPLIHPPPFYYWTPPPLANPIALLQTGQPIPFTVCQTDEQWTRPSEAEQNAVVWSKRPFRERSENFLRWWYEQRAVVYDTIDMFEQSFPEGPSLDALASDWRFLLGMWNGAELTRSRCSYDAQTLNALLNRQQIEVWLLGYHAQKIRRWDVATTPSPVRSQKMIASGAQYALEVIPAPGFQIIRFPGNGGVIAIHLIGRGKEISELPKFCRADPNADCAR